MQDRLETQSGIRPDLEKAIDFCKQCVLLNADFSQDEKNQIIFAYDAFLEKFKYFQCGLWPFGDNTTQLELPDKLAAGFACALAGSLLCIIPGGQSVGLTLIGSGISIALDGLAEGERPYYIDTKTGQRYPFMPLSP